MTSRSFHFHALEKEMATHSSILAWRIPETGSLVGCHLWGRTESDTTEAAAAAAGKRGEWEEGQNDFPASAENTFSLKYFPKVFQRIFLSNVNSCYEE